MITYFSRLIYIVHLYLWTNWCFQRHVCIWSVNIIQRKYTLESGIRQCSFQKCHARMKQCTFQWKRIFNSLQIGSPLHHRQANLAFQCHLDELFLTLHLFFLLKCVLGNWFATFNVSKLILNCSYNETNLLLLSWAIVDKLQIVSMFEIIARFIWSSVEKFGFGN